MKKYQIYPVMITNITTNYVVAYLIRMNGLKEVNERSMK